MRNRPSALSARNYSATWQTWNQIRALACTAAVLLTGVGLIKIGSISPTQKCPHAN
ncbi:hypothetical protein OEG84_00925 [Hoeflea sp. G2-23]|uniref:Uncharacterized protein n=1 Tax=Hoeflea algicola TaxID=2983763 RepID=A0ABT3Z3H2_9HYPH|nr:hypothetical protein [Hoeflea algicola]MCY0146317.1 hypothetical protein [Hoeflea algicola]